MRKGKFNKIINGFAVAFALAFGMLLMTGTSVSAQSRDYRDNGRVTDERRGNDRDDQNWRGDRGITDRAVKQAYQSGFSAGQQKAMSELRSRRGRGWNGGAFNGSYGNFGGVGRNGQVRQAYQNGFNAGYQQTMSQHRNDRGGRRPF
ncbi:MAG TPA: hypothetical protein VGJ02_08245 [Pyrinomonadaceae bacterium]|jgi:hypothetical protein